MQCTTMQCMSCCCNDKLMKRCHAYCCQPLMHMLSSLLPVYVSWHSLTQKLQCKSSNACACSGILSIYAYWWTASSYIACVLCTITCKCWVTISLTVQSLYLPDRTTSSISAVSGSSAADFTAVCLCNVICLGCAASDCLVTWTGSLAGPMLWLDEFVFCAKMSSAKKYFCSKGAHCALSTWYDKAHCHGKASNTVDRLTAAAWNYMLVAAGQSYNNAKLFLMRLV